MFKPLFEADGWKPVDRKYVPPTHDRNHPKGATQVRGVQGQLKTRRKAIAGLRDTMALAGSSSKTARFIPSNLPVDKRLDAPVVLVGTHTPVRRTMQMKAVVPCRRG